MEAQTAPASTPARSYPVSPYQPDGGFDTSGIGLLTGVMMVAAVLLGALCHLVGQFFWLVLIFPVLIGLLLGAIGTQAVRFARLRNPMLGGLVGLLGGITAMTAMHYGDYLQLRREIDRQMASANPVARTFMAMSQDQVRQFVHDEPLADQQRILRAWQVTHIDSFPAFMDFSAQQGVSISHHGSKGIELGYTGTWIYWIIEVLIVAGMTYAMVKSATAEPYCVACDQWKTRRPLGSFNCDPAAAKAALESGSISELAQRHPMPTIVTSAGLLVTLAQCSHCAGQGALDLKLELLTTKAKEKTQRKTLTHVTYPADAQADLQSLFAPPRPSCA